MLEDNPSAAEHVYDAIMDSVARLVTFPEMGRRGRVPGTRELVIASQPYVSPTVSGADYPYPCRPARCAEVARTVLSSTHDV